MARPVAENRALVNRAARRLGRPASIPRAIRCRSPEALALGAAGIACRRRYHCPERGCLFSRSRDCSRLGAHGHCMPASLSLPLRRLPLSPASASLRKTFLLMGGGLKIGAVSTMFADGSFDMLGFVLPKVRT
jgi:hypothetical protein